MGDPNYDHIDWVTSAYQSMSAVEKGGDPRPVVALTKGGGASAAQFTAALAIMARLAPQFGTNAYADSCIEAALRGYEYAKNNYTTPCSNGGF
ncbi:MAG: glycoside hydrolase family 9 protein [Chitinivibrionales bacterium]